MFSKSTWSIVGLDTSTEALRKFHAATINDLMFLTVSQLAQSAVCRFINIPTLGINPYHSPRMDETKLHVHGEDMAITDYDARLLAKAVTDESTDEATLRTLRWGREQNYGSVINEFKITEGVYGFHFVFNEFKDNSHAASMKEDMAYKETQKPYKFLSGDDKKLIDGAVNAKITLSRKQVVVLVDINAGYIFMETASKEQISQITDLLFTHFDLTIESLGWQFSNQSWPTAALAEIFKTTDYTVQLGERARAIASAAKSGEEITPYEDPFIENVVKNYFAVSNKYEAACYTIGLSAPAKISLHGTPPVAAGTPTDATELLEKMGGSFIMQADVTLAHIEEVPDKKNGGTRKGFFPQFSFVLSPGSMAVTEVGAILMKGFDVPSFVRGIKRQIRKTKVNFDIPQFWEAYHLQLLRGMNAIENTLLNVLGDDEEREKYGIKRLAVERNPSTEENDMGMDDADRAAVAEHLSVQQQHDSLTDYYQTQEAAEQVEGDLTVTVGGE